MAKNSFGDALKAKFRPDESVLDNEIDAALAGVALDELYAKDRQGRRRFHRPPAPVNRRATGALCR